MVSSRFRQLRDRIAELVALMPPSSPTGSYSAEQFDLIRAFQLLAHAEIEAYLEDVACSTLTEALSRWKRDGIPRVCLSHVVLHLEFRRLPPKWSSGSQLERVEEACERFATYARKKNNGVKERNVMALLLPIGLTIRDIDATWLATIDSFGSGRGEIAHTAKSVQTPPDRDTLVGAVDQIIAGLEQLDLELVRLPSRRLPQRTFIWANEISQELAHVQSGPR